MINQIQNKSEIRELNNFDVYSIRILSLLNAYGCNYNFASFYVQINDDNEITAIISRLDSDFTLSFTEKADKDELIDFFSMISFSSLLCSPNFVLNRSYEQGKVMKSQKKIEISYPHTEIDEYPKLMDIFSLTDYEAQDFKSWYADLNHRIRHGCAKAYTLNVNDEIVSSALFSFIYGDYAILSSVKTKKEFTRLGYGSCLVSYMNCDFGKTVYLLREENRNENFYKRLGFENCSDWRMYK